MGGTLLVVLVEITGSEVVKTAVLAAVVSFGVSWLLQRWVKRRR